MSNKNNNTAFDTIKVNLLHRKINEHFKKHPKAKSVIIKANFDKSNTYWKVTKSKKNKYNIQEVSTVSKNIVLEVDDKEKKSSDELDEPKSSDEPSEPITDPDENGGSEGEEDDQEPEQEEETPVEEPQEEPQEEPEQDAPQKEKSQEQLYVSKALKGQTINDADVELSQNGGKLFLHLVGMEIPVELEWDNSGKVALNYKNRPYFLRRG